MISRGSGAVSTGASGSAAVSSVVSVVSVASVASGVVPVGKMGFSVTATSCNRM